MNDLYINFGHNNNNTNNNNTKIILIIIKEKELKNRIKKIILWSYDYVHENQNNSIYHPVVNSAKIVV